jgi:uncharacterized protein
MSQFASSARRQFVQMGLAAAGLSIVRADGATPADAQVTAQRSTFLVVYRPGPAWVAGKPLAQQTPKGHFNYMLELYRRGLLRVAGPFKDGSGGAVLFEAASDESAKALIDADPAVVLGVFSYELHRWSLVPWDKALPKN